jgi:hypothetical protein
VQMEIGRESRISEQEKVSRSRFGYQNRAGKVGERADTDVHSCCLSCTEVSMYLRMYLYRNPFIETA